MYSISDTAGALSSGNGCRLWTLMLASARLRRANGGLGIRREPEVVWVFEDFRLIDAESYQHVYARPDGKALPRGYYIATWPVGVKGRMYGEETLFNGPYLCREQAEMMLQRAANSGCIVVYRPLAIPAESGRRRRLSPRTQAIGRGNSRAVQVLQRHRAWLSVP